MRHSQVHKTEREVHFAILIVVGRRRGERGRARVTGVAWQRRNVTNTEVIEVGSTGEQTKEGTKGLAPSIRVLGGGGRARRFRGRSVGSLLHLHGLCSHRGAVRPN